MRDKLKGKPPLDLYQAVREIACRLDEVIDYLNNNDPAFGDKYVRTFNGETGDVVGVSSVNGQTGDVTVQGGGSVDSVNGKTGEVTLTGDDISLSASDDQSVSGVIGTLYGPDNVPPYPVTSVNNKTGAVKIKGSDIPVSDGNNESIAAELAKKYDASNQPPYPVTSVNGQTGDVEISTGGGAVDSVNGKTGAVLLTASDINATAGGTVQQNIDTFSSDIEELGNEVNTLQQGVSNLETEVDGKYSASNPPPYPVTSVNGKTGAVTGLYSAENPPPYPVTSVNGRKGDTWVSYLYDSANVVSLRVQTGESPYITLCRNDGTSFRGISLTATGPRVNNYNESGSWVSSYAIYSEISPPAFKNQIDANTAWIVGTGWGSYNKGLLLYTINVTPDESGWITIPWPNTVTSIHAVISYVANSAFPATLYNITINSGSNIRAALSYGSSPWPNQNPFQLNLLMIAD